MGQIKAYLYLESLCVQIIFVSFIFLSSCQLQQSETNSVSNSNETDNTSTASTRLVTGTLDGDSSLSNSKTAKNKTQFGCQADQVIAINASGQSAVSSLDGACSFNLKLKKGKSYIISFTRDGDFVATITFNKIASSILPIVEGDGPLDLGGIFIEGKRARCHDEEEAICDIDTDGDGISICEDLDEHDYENEYENDYEVEEEEDCDPEHKVEICHVPPGNPDNAHTICVDYHAVRYVNHLKHGDTIGACYSEEDDGEEEVVMEEEEEYYEEEDESDSDVACQGVLRARFDYFKIMNWHNGDLEELVFLGIEDEPVAGSQWFDLTDETGSIIIDQYVNRDVPGIALQRGPGWIHFNFWGHHPRYEGKEAFIGMLVLDGAAITHVVNDKRGPFERQGDGIAVFGRPGQDEYEIGNTDNVLKVTATVTVHRDGFRVYYFPDVCVH